MKRKWMCLMMVLVLCLGLLPGSSLAFDPNAYKANISKVSIGKPVTSAETGKQYIPVTVYFNCKENPDDGSHALLEGIVKALHDGAEHDVSGVGMTLQRVPSNPGNNQFEWDPETGEGRLKYNVPVLGNGEAQTVEHSDATGRDEVNGLKENNTLIMKLETVVTGYPEGPIVSNEAKIVYNPSELPKDYPIGDTPDPVTTCRITFDPNGGKGTMTAMEVESETETTLPKNTFTKAKNLFIKWNTKKDGSGTSYGDGAKISVTEDTTLFAQWGKINISLSKVTVKKGKKATLKATVKAGKIPIKDAKVTFKFNGKTYNAKTNAKGIAKKILSAKVTKKLKVGKTYKLTASFLGVTTSKKIKVRK